MFVSVVPQRFNKCNEATRLWAAQRWWVLGDQRPVEAGMGKRGAGSC